VPFLIVSNASAGSGDDLPSLAAERLDDVRTLQLEDGVDLASVVREAVDDGRTIVACGGDGTVNALAHEVVERDGTLGVLPGGTLNHFARDLGLLDPEVALGALERHETRPVDVGRVDGRVFVNNVAMGVYPELVRERERHEGRLGKWLALAVGAARVFRTFEPVDGTIEADGDARRLDATLVLVGNNRYSTTPGSIGTRERLDEGILDVRVVRARRGLRARSVLAAGLLRSGWDRRFVGTTASTVRIDVGSPEPFAVDGEQRDDARELEISIDPGALRVVTPR
jgi:diacylglycerol kinase family enzyme